MTHDALCPVDKSQSEAIALNGKWIDPSGVVCICERLERVREDERMTFQFVKDIRAAALRDAVAAVEKYLDEGTCPDCSFTSRDREIVSAIEALGGER